MKTSWTQGVGKELAVDIKQNYKESLVLRRRLRELLEKKMSTSWRSSQSKDGYSSPNWAYTQADARGYERAMREILELISDEVVDES